MTETGDKSVDQETEHEIKMDTLAVPDASSAGESDDSEGEG
jgi:hypothetical protein